MGYSINNVASFRGLMVENGDIQDYESYDEFLDSDGPVSVGGLAFYPSRILSELDPIAYSCGYNDYIDELQCELENALDDEDYSNIEWINNPNQSIIDEFSNIEALPIMELEIKTGYTIVELSIDDDHLNFSIEETDSNKVFFDGDIIDNGHGNYSIEFNKDNVEEGLYAMLQLISDNIIDGWLIPNGLFPDAE